jgi:DNA polymerase-3 subunit gamma/tau
MLGHRYFDLEIRASIEAFRREPRAGTAFLLVRAVRKLLRRFDAVLLSDSRAKKVESAVAKVEEALQELEPAEGRADLWQRNTGKELSAQLSNLESLVAAVQQQLPHDPVPVDAVRSIAAWAQLSSSTGVKVAIIEEAHQLQEAARNAMLKLLEEPPSGVFLILTSSRRTAMIPTLLSRLRVYAIAQRSPGEEVEVQQRIFRVEEPASPRLQDFFRQHHSAADSWAELAGAMISAARGERDRREVSVKLREQLAGVPPRSGAEYLLDALLELLRADLRQGETARVQEWAILVRSHWDRITTRNVNPLSTLERLLVAMTS